MSTPAPAPEAIDALRQACKGTVAIPGEPDYESFVYGGLWNRLIPQRGPSVVVRVVDEHDVVEVIRFARAQSLKVTVRGGGHNWCQPSLRNGGVLIDLSGLNQVLSIDVEARRAVVQPIVSNRDIQRVLNAKGLAFPSGHCPEVKLSGYFLGGGMAWNQGTWGYGNESVEAVEIVTPAGELITASATENPEWFWAVRGAGYGFFGVVTKYHLRLHALPAAIHVSSYTWSLDDAAAVGDWLGANAARFSPKMELTLFLLTAPKELEEAARANGGKAALVTATAFAETAEEAAEILAALDECPLIEQCLARTPVEPATFEQLFDASGAMWPKDLRNRVKAVFSDASPGTLAEAVAEHMPKSPSPITLVLFTIFTGPNVPAPLPDAALSHSARVYGGPWTQWTDAADDDANTAWHDECVARLKPHVVGYYIGETDPVAVPSEATGAFSPANWKRLADLRDKYDPDRVFFDYFDGFSDA